MTRSIRRTPAGERGSTTLEVAVLAPGMLIFIALIVYMARYEMAGQAVQHAAAEAARDASIFRDAGAAHSMATAAANRALSEAGLDCSTKTVNVDSSKVAKAAGQTGSVKATVACTVSRGDLPLPGVKIGNPTITRTAISPVDTYRE